MKKRILFLLFTISSTSLTYSQWAQVGADIYGQAPSYYAGFSVSLSADGNIVAIGGHSEGASSAENTGRVRILENVGGTWTQIGLDIEDGLDFWTSQNPGSVSLSADGSIVCIGVPFGNSGSGFTRVYENVAGTWTQIGLDIAGEASDDLSGNSVSLSDDGNILAIGAPENNDNGPKSGHVRVYENIGGTWIKKGQDIDGESAFDESGFSVSLSADGNILAIGAPKNDDNGFNSGQVRVYENIGDTWTQIGLDIGGESNSDRSGFSVSLNAVGSIVAIGAFYNDASSEDVNSGHVRIYENIGGTWTQIGQDIDGEERNDQSGHSVSINGSGSIVAIGAPYNYGNGYNSGHVRLYKNTGGTWTQIGVDIDGEVIWDLIGLSVSLSDDGSKIAIGEPYNDGNGDQSGRVRVFENASLLSLETFSLQDFVIYPNPVITSLSIKSKINIESIVIYDINGRKLKSITPSAFSLELLLDVKELSKGIYLIELQSSKLNQVKKFIKK